MMEYYVLIQNRSLLFFLHNHRLTSFLHAEKDYYQPNTLEIFILFDKWSVRDILLCTLHKNTSCSSVSCMAAHNSRRKKIVFVEATRKKNVLFCFVFFPFFLSFLFSHFFKSNITVSAWCNHHHHHHSISNRQTSFCALAFPRTVLMFTLYKSNYVPTLYFFFHLLIINARQTHSSTYTNTYYSTDALKTRSATDKINEWW